MFTPLFIVAGAVECLPCLINFNKPDWLFPGINRSGKLAACWWTPAAFVLGIGCFIASYFDDNGEGKPLIAIIILDYHLSIVTMTVIKLIRGEQVDGPDPPCVTRFTQSQLNVIKGVLSIVLHLGLAIFFIIFLSLKASGLWIFCWAVITAPVSMILSARSVFTAIPEL